MKNLKADKKIYFYWEQGFREAPDFVKTNLLIWKKLTPEYRLIFLDRENVGKIVPPKYFSRHLNVQLRSDLIRLFLLEKYGGFWVDATLLPSPAISDFLDLLTYQEIFFFRNPSKKRILSNWFIYGKKGHPFLRRWRCDLEQAADVFNKGPLEIAPKSQKAVYRLLALWDSDLALSKLGKKALDYYPYFLAHQVAKAIDNKNPGSLPAKSSETFTTDACLRLYKELENDLSGISDIMEIYCQSPVHKLSYKGKLGEDELAKFMGTINSIIASGWASGNFSEGCPQVRSEGW